MKRSQFLWNILVGLAVVILIAGALRLNSMRKHVVAYRRVAEQTQVGTDQRLNRTIAFLESNLQERDAFRFNLSNQPMLLTNVIYLSEEYARTQHEKVLRVTAIIGASPSIALVRYEGETHQLSPGDTLAGGTVVDVRPKELIMRFGGRITTFPVLGLSMSAEEAQKYRIE